MHLAKRLQTAVMLGCCGLLFGCGGMSPGAGRPGEIEKTPEQGQEQAVKPADPVTITVFMPPGYFLDEEFDRYVAQPVHAKYPYITVKLLRGDNKDIKPETLVASGDIPDLFVGTNTSMLFLRQLGLETDIQPLVDKFKLDLGRFKPGIVDLGKSLGSKGQLVGIPYIAHFNAMYYNKQLFDKFGVGYPKDGMTWPQVYELAKKVTRSEDGVQYRGVDLPTLVQRVSSQLSLTYIDSRTQKASVNTDGWKQLFQFFKDVYAIPGNAPQGDPVTLFVQNRTLAMLPYLNIVNRFADTPDLDWDMVSFPTFPQAPGVGLAFDAHVVALAATSKHKDDAFRVIETLTSDEVMLDIARGGKFVTLMDPTFADHFGEALPYMKGKNVKAASLTSPSPAEPVTELVTFARTAVNKAFTNSGVKSDTDINTALRQAEEEINQYGAQINR